MLCNTIHSRPSRIRKEIFTHNKRHHHSNGNKPENPRLDIRQKLTYAKHINRTTIKAKSTINIIKALSSKEWGKQKETILTTYNAITKPHLEYACTIWGPIASNTNISKLQTIQNTALRISTGCTRDTNTQHLHEETKSLPIDKHIKLHSSLFRQKSQHPQHPCHNLTTQSPNRRHLKQTIYDNDNDYTCNIKTDPLSTTEEAIKINCKTIHTTIVLDHLSSLKPNKILNQVAPPVDRTEISLPRRTRCLLAQLRTGKSKYLLTYLNHINPQKYPSHLCPKCSSQPHDVHHLFNCTHIPTTLTVLDLWTNPKDVADLMDLWRENLPHLQQ
jgi:hypothetical protein